ncbi:11586_t:CDS:2 [Diversispora eburnea]|uniref:11586_t:CDS:1 n=1 Tax=Diversispora eburnea TaxID=1213867 RepID=A0A9N9AIY9_9GLOM|nr:11586_t:CDS:2 [Diversispora eburnea]
MAGPNLELFKFAVYIFFPVATMYYFGAPEFYEKHVKMVRKWPENTPNIPNNQKDILEELKRLKAERLAKKNNNSTDS